MSEILERLKRLAEQRQLLDERTGINMQNTFKDATETIERMEKVCEIYRCERDRQAAIVESLISRLSHIHGLIQPDHIKLPDGRTMEFAPPPELLMECWRGLSKAIREIPDDLEGLNKTNGDRLERMEKECEQQRDIGGNTPDVLVSRELMAAQITRIERMEKVVEDARAVIDRWDAPTWKDVEPTARFINRLRASVASLEKTDIGTGDA